MSWWVIALIVFVVLRLRREGGAVGSCQRRHSLRSGPRSWQERQATSLPPAPAVPDARSVLQGTIEAVRQEYVAGRIGVEEYERRLDELYRTAEGKRLVQGA